MYKILHGVQAALVPLVGQPVTHSYNYKLFIFVNVYSTSGGREGGTYINIIVESKYSVIIIVVVISTRFK